LSHVILLDAVCGELESHSARKSLDPWPFRDYNGCSFSCSFVGGYSMATLQVTLLGPMEIRFDGQQLRKPPTLKSRSLLAYLIMHRDRPQPRECLVDLFWGDRPERKARRSLTTALWHIRRCLPDEGLILSELNTVQFDPGGELWLDVDEFQAQASRQDIASLQSAVALYRGDLMDGFYDDWILTERYRLEQLLCGALTRLMTARERMGDHGAALSTAARLLEQDPLREDAHRAMMRAYCRLGRRNAALEQYHDCQRIVQEELGVEPMAETTELKQQILDGRFATETVTEGVSIEVPSFRPAPAAGRNPLDVATRTKLVGREEELAFLQDQWHSIAAGRGGLVLVSGEAGVGKTRLVEEFSHDLRSRGAQVLWGRCYEFERVLPYQPIADALHSLLPRLTASELQCLPAWTVVEMARLVPEVLEKLPGIEDTITIAPYQERARFFEATIRVLAELSSRAPLLLVLEDLQWAGESTLQLLHYLVHHLAGERLLLVGTFRPEGLAPGHPVLDLRRRLTRERLVQSLRLSRLVPADVEAMVKEVSGAGDAIVPLAGRLYRETEGNPFFLSETVNALFEMGLIRLKEAAWEGDWDRLSREALPLPASVGELIQARTDRLEDDTQDALKIAAVLGREFDFDLLNAVWGRGEDATLEALDRMLRQRLIDEGLGTTARDYAFSHHKIQEAIYAGIPRRHRQQAHARVATAMEQLYASQTEDLAGELAFHFREGVGHDKRLAEKAIEHLLTAADQARLAYAQQEAIGYYQQALEILKGQRALRKQRVYERSARTLMALGLTYQSAFQFEQARQAYDEGFHMWQRASELERASAPPAAPHPLRVHLSSPLWLDPTLASDSESGVLVDQLFCGLVSLTPRMGIQPDVADSWEVSEEGRRYLFRLRDDVTWSDGVPVTADDFEFAWKRVLDLATGSRMASVLYDIAGARAFHSGECGRESVAVHAVDELTLVVELEAPTGYFLQLLAHSSTYPVPSHAVQAHGESWSEPDKIVTNGPFRLASWNRDASMVLTHNPAYHGRRRGNVDQVELRLLPDGAWSARWQMYQAGGLDVLNLKGSPALERDRARHQYPSEYVSGPRLSTDYTAFITNRKPFDDPRVRRAFGLAIDREGLREAVSGADSAPATGGFIPVGMPGHSAGIGLPYDPKRARDLLAEAGYPGGRGFPAAGWLCVPGSEPFLEYMQTQWHQNLGVEVHWEVLEIATLIQRLNQRPAHMFSLRWVADYPDPDSFLRANLIRRYTRWRNPTYEGLVERARRSTEQAERMKLYAQADRILIEEAVLLPAFYGRTQLLVKPWVSRYPTSPVDRLFWKDVVIESH
jgi:ABC-type oligopeptide transport system substrate-binding subunit/DNA-binding SARP family transcriptional activator